MPKSNDKPVAWRTKNKWGAWSATTSDLIAQEWTASGRKVEPLYVGAEVNEPRTAAGSLD